jgi:hypothetical protein
VFCKACGCAFTDITRPKTYSERENQEWYEGYKAVMNGDACWLNSDGKHKPCRACREWQDAEELKIENRLRASAHPSH